MIAMRAATAGLAGESRALPATLTASQAAQTAWQAIVIGAGPAGSSAAWRLAARGIRTLLVERGTFPRGKVCGCCLSALAIRELADLGADACPAAAIQLDSVRLCHGGRAVRIPLPRGRVVSRALLDMHLTRRAIAAGCQWLPHAQALAIQDDPGDPETPITVVLRSADPAAGDAHELRTQLVVLATGLTDNVRIAGAESRGRMDRLLGRIGAGGVLPAASCDLPAGELVMAVGRGGYCGLVRLEDGRIDVAAAIDRAVLAHEKEPGRALARLLAEAGAPASCRLPGPDAFREASFRATPPLTRRSPLACGPTRRILRIGDTAGYVEPFTGEGIGWALASGRILAESVTDRGGLAAPAAAAARYVAAHHAQFRRLHARCRFVAHALRRPLLVGAAVTAAHAMPWAARILAPVVVGAPARGVHR